MMTEMERLSAGFATSLAPTTAGEPIRTRIVYIPEGDHEINATIDGTPGTRTVRVSAERGEGIASALNTQLQERRAENVRPIFDFDHAARGPVAAYPTEFSFEQGRGIVADVEWSGAGKRAIEDRDFGYFSPDFLIDSNGVPTRLPARGPLGSLVNDPAFRQIERIAAARAESTAPQTMSNQLVKCGLVTEAEANSDHLESIAASRVQSLNQAATELSSLKAANATLTEERDQLAARVESNLEAQADTEILAAVQAGRIAPKDEESKAFWKQSIKASGESAIKALRAQPSRDNPSVPVVNMTASQINSGDQESRIQAAEAKAKGELGASATPLQVYNRAEQIDPDAFAL